MRIYAERPGRALLQVLADVAVLAWALLVVHLARAVHAAVLTLQDPANRLTGAGDSIRGAFDGAARTAAGVPFVGADLARALGTGTDAGDSLATSGRDLAASVASAATGVAAAIVLVGIVPVVVVWLALRARWVRAARSARVARVAGPDLLALQPSPAGPRARCCASIRTRPRRGGTAIPPSSPRSPDRAGGAGAAVAGCRAGGQPVTVTLRVSVMTGRPAPSDGSSSATRIS